MVIVRRILTVLPLMPVVIFLIVTSCSEKNPVEHITIESYEWNESPPEAQGLDSAIIENGFGEAQKTSFINGIVIVRNGYLVAEKYFNDHDKNMTDLIYSATKSVMSALIGIAIEENIIDSLDQRMLDFFPQYVSLNIDPKKHDITIRHLLTMRAGFDTDDHISEQIQGCQNMIEAIIATPLIFNPGEDFCYTSYGVHLLSGIITEATGISTLEYAKRMLFKSIGVHAVAWEMDQNGYMIGGGGLYATPRDMARFGYLYLEKGQVEGDQIIPSQWIEDSIQELIRIDDQWGEMEDVGYGYLWWTGKINAYSLYFASGFGGQFIMNIPVLNMVVAVTTDGSSENANKQYEPILHIISEYILGAIKN